MHKKHQNTYSFRYKRYFSRFPFCYIKIKKCIGHEYEAKSDMMKIFTKGGGLRTVRKWKECELFLKSDFGNFIQEHSSQEANKRGLSINEN